jgi:hypothetical protein
MTVGTMRVVTLHLIRYIFLSIVCSHTLVVLFACNRHFWVNLSTYIWEYFWGDVVLWGKNQIQDTSTNYCGTFLLTCQCCWDSVILRQVGTHPSWGNEILTSNMPSNTCYLWYSLALIGAPKELLIFRNVLILKLCSPSCLSGRSGKSAWGNSGESIH